MSHISFIDMCLDKDREFLTGFLERYRDLECLWCVKSRDYANKVKRNKAYQDLVKYCKPYYASANLLWVKKKIQNVRTVFYKGI